MSSSEALSKLGALLPDCVCRHDAPVAVGWSGGADSTALLLALRQRGVPVIAWHVDHGWREDSTQEAQTLATLAEGWGIPFYQARVQPAGNNREHMARQARYACFARWSAAQKIRHLYLAHHAADQAETVCMRLLQGSGVAGCRGMSRTREYCGLQIHRPWLNVEPEKLRACLQQAGVPWLEDPSNRDCSLWRNRIRLHLFPAMQQAGVDPQRLFRRWRAQAVRIAAALEQDTADIALQRDDDGVCVHWREWAALPAAARASLLQRMMGLLFGEGVRAGRRHILLAETWTAQGGRGGLDLSRCRLEREKSCLHLRRTRAMLR